MTMSNDPQLERQRLERIARSAEARETNAQLADAEARQRNSGVFPDGDGR